MKFSLKQKLTGILALIAGTGCAALITLGILNQSTSVDGKETLARTANQTLIDTIDRNLFERYGDVQAFSLSEPARSGNPQRITAFISDMMAAYTPVYDMMIVTNASGKVIAANNVDKSGKPMDVSSIIGKDYSDRDWFKKAISGEIKPGSSFVEDLHVDSDVKTITNTDGNVMNFTAPIRDASTGKVTGVWTNRVSWNDVIQTIAKEVYGKIKGERVTHVFSYILSSSGMYLMHPLGKEFELSQSWTDKLTETSSVSSKDVALGDFKGAMIESVEFSKGYSTYPGIGWRSVLQIPKNDRQSFQSILFIIASCVLFLGASIAGYFVVARSSQALTQLNSDLDREASKVAEASATIAEASRSLADSSTLQGSSLQETAASIEELNAMVKKSADNAKQSADVADQAQSSVERGKLAVKRMMDSMREIEDSNHSIKKQIDSSNEEIGAISQIISQIGSKTKVINEIVFQTKLLSFNASVEAARAGEHGKGFAVVAEEVGNLAQMSGSAAKEISDMLAASIEKVTTTVNTSKSKIEALALLNTSKIEAGNDVARECDKVLDEVDRQMLELSNMVKEISTATQEQSQGINEITKAMNQLDESTHQNATTSRMAAESSENLSGQSKKLYIVAGELSVLVDGKSESQVKKAA